MNLRELANADLKMIVEDKATGFGWDIALTSPSGQSSAMVGFSNDIALAIDPDTGVLVSGRTVSVALYIASLREKGFEENPQNVMEKNRKPWVVGFKDINGVPTLFKVIRSNPDRAIGLITLILETYKQAVFFDGAWFFDGAQEYDGVLDLI